MPQEEKSETADRCPRPSDRTAATSATMPSASRASGSSAGSRMPSLYAAEPRLDQEEILRARNAALSLGRAAHGTRAQLLHRRRARPLHVDERLQRASSHGLGFVRLARGKCGDPEQHAAARVDAAQHRQHEGADEAPRLRLRLVARSHHLPARILPLEPVVLPQAVRARVWPIARRAK